jgi:hypothetical protein
VENAVMSIRQLRDGFIATDPERTISLMKQAIHCTKLFAGSVMIPPDESGLRDLFDSIIHLDNVAKSIVEITYTNPTGESWELFISFIYLLAELRRISEYGANRISTFFADDFDYFKSECESCSSDTRKTLIENLKARHLSFSETLKPRAIQFQ